MKEQNPSHNLRGGEPNPELEKNHQAIKEEESENEGESDKYDK